MILGVGYTAPAVAARRQAAAMLQRRGGVDVNVSCLAVASTPVGEPDGGGGLLVTRIGETGPDAARLAAERVRQRRRNRALERSRRSTNAAQYQQSVRQQRRAERRVAAGLREIQVAVPGGPRVANAAGIPVQAYRRDHVSAAYRRLRGQAATAGAARTRAAQTRARSVAGGLVAVHGADLIVEDCDLRGWARRWGRGVHAFTPGMLLAALHREAAKVADVSGRGGLVRAGTRHTAWTQHCLCGTRVPKQLRHRRHVCPVCGLAGDRDLVAALVGAHTVLAEPGVPGSARIDWTAAKLTLAAYGVGSINEGLHGALPGRGGRSTAPALAAGAGVLGEVPD